GDPGGDSFFFGRLDTIYAGFATAADDPSSSVGRTQALSNVEDFLSEADRVNTQITQLAGTMDTRITAGVDRANDLLQEIDRLNTDISRAKLLRSDASGSENIQSSLVDELSTLMNVRVSARTNGGVDIRSQEGVQLAGDGAATLTYEHTDSTQGYLSVTSAGSGLTRPMSLTSGEIQGLLELRDQRLPEMSDQLGEFVSRAVEQLNAAHNASSAVPPPTTLEGRATGLDLPTAVSGFSGTSTVAIAGPDGVVKRKVAIDFTAGTMSVDGGAASAFTPATFLSSLNTALTGFGTAAFSATGALSLTATSTSTTSSGPVTDGVAIDKGTAVKAGRGFSQFFGLNDMVKSTGITSYETGLKATSPHGFIAGDQIQLRIAQADGRPIKDVTVTVPAAANMSDLLASLNSSTTGVGLSGQFVLDANGAMTFQGSGSPPANVAVIKDDTKRGAGGPSISELFGIGTEVRTARAGQFNVNQALVRDPSKLALATLDLTVAAGQPALRPGDGTGALAISGAGDVPTLFQAAGDLGAVTMTIARYANEFGGSIGRNAAAAQTRTDSAKSVQTEATARRQSVESVNMDEELVQLQTYQQAFNASARMIQAAKDMYDTLMALV
ncbi:MAG: flaN, partial [Caulobacteraceae bacterium]|nr:flaN [Caulobacteraceae bacterium]